MSKYAGIAKAEIEIGEAKVICPKKKDKSYLKGLFIRSIVVAVLLGALFLFRAFEFSSRAVDFVRDTVSVSIWDMNGEEFVFNSLIENALSEGAE
ncbi:MAG: hypothetical protein FWC82_02590 [Firmicutes bacterium]|nr:hypothetical protein [Bacillota bacterium]